MIVTILQNFMANFFFGKNQILRVRNSLEISEKISVELCIDVRKKIPYIFRLRGLYHKQDTADFFFSLRVSQKQGIARISLATSHFYAGKCNVS